MSNRGPGRVLVLSFYHPWISGGGHRPHQLLREELRRGRDILFAFLSPTGMDEIPLGAAEAPYEQLLLFRVAGPDQEPQPVNAAATAKSKAWGSWAALVDAFAPDYARAHNPVEAYLPLVDDLRRRGVPFIYDQMDHWRDFAAQPWGAASTDDEYVRRADAVVTVSHVLSSMLQTDVPVKVVPNAVDADFATNAASPRPRPGVGPPHVLYMGAMWPTWFDWPLAIAVASALPVCRFTFVGPVRATPDEDRHGDVVQHVEELATLPNVRLHDEVEHSDLPGFLRDADLGIVPFRVAPITVACSPLKVFEYLSAGLGVVATQLPEIASYPGVRIACDSRDFVELVGHMAAERRMAPVPADQQRFVTDSTWASRVEAFDELMEHIR